MVMRKRPSMDQLDLVAASSSQSTEQEEFIRIESEKEETKLLAPVLVESLLQKSHQIFRLNEYSHDDFPSISRTGPAPSSNPLYLPIMDDDDDVVVVEEEGNGDDEDSCESILRTLNAFEEKKEEENELVVGPHQGKTTPLYHDDSCGSLETQNILLAQYISLTEYHEANGHAPPEEDADDDNDKNDLIVASPSRQREGDAVEESKEEMEENVPSERLANLKNRGFRTEATPRSGSNTSMGQLEWFLSMLSCNMGLCAADLGEINPANEDSS